MSERSPRKAQRGGRWLRRLKFSALLVLLVLGLIVFFQNINKQDTYDVFFWDPQVPRALLLVGTFAVGAIVGAVATYLLRRSHG
ncbi:MAG: hypothetical protein ACYS8K_08065 [Planctomycetota bacterium]